MALTISDIGNAGNGVASASIVTGATITASINDWLVAIAAADNAGASGASAISSIQDSGGNGWTNRVLATRSPGSAANDGATGGCWTTQITTALSSGTVTLNFSPNVTAKGLQVYRVQPGAGESVAFVAADAAANVGTANPQSSNSVSVTIGHTIFGFICMESRLGSPGDSDTTNGSWSTLAERGFDSGALVSSMACLSQYKTVSATGSQQYNNTVGGGTPDFIGSYLILQPVLNTSLIFQPPPAAFLSQLVR